MTFRDLVVILSIAGIPLIWIGLERLRTIPRGASFLRRCGFAGVAAGGVIMAAAQSRIGEHPSDTWAAARVLLSGGLMVTLAGAIAWSRHPLR